MSILYEFPNYTSEQLEEAKKSMRKSQAYRLASEYYSILNYNKEFNNHRIDIETRDKYQKEVEQRTSSELEERDGYRKCLGSELLPSTDVEFEKKLKKALIIVDDDFRNGNGDIDFMARFASILPKPFLNMVFVLSINNHNDEMLSAISRNELENILEFDNMLLKEYPDLRLKAINSGVVYPSILLDYAMVEINGGLTTDFTHAADIYTLLNSEQRADNGLFMKIKMDCFDNVQVHCQDIAQYQRNKQIFFEKVLKIKRGKESNLSEMIGNVPKCQLEKSPVLCPMDYAVERFLDFFLLPEVYNGDGEYRNSNDKLEEWADRIVEIDIEERRVSLEKYFQFHKEQPINRTAKEAAALKYANDIVRRKIADVKTAKKYIEMHKKDGDFGYIDPNETTMQMIMEEYGNAPEIKELLFADCYKLNHLWDVIPYDSIPDDYTIYEKMMAGTQILATDFSRIDEIPDDIRARIFDSKDCITRILFPGLQYQSEFGSAAGKLELGYYSRGIKPERLLIQVLGKMSSRLKEAGYIDEIRKMYDMYNVSHISFFKCGIDWVTLQSVLTLNELKSKPKSLAEVFGLTPIDDNLSEFIVEDEEEKSVPDSDYYSTYDLNESHKAKELLTIPQSIQIIKAYYKANKYLIGDIKSKGLSNYEDKDYIRQEAIDGSRLLAQETRLVGRGEFVRMALLILIICYSKAD